MTTVQPTRNPVARWSSSESAENPGMMIMNEHEKHYRKPNNVNPRFHGPIPRDSVTEIQFVTADPPTTHRRTSADSEDYPRTAFAVKSLKVFRFHKYFINYSIYK